MERVRIDAAAHEVVRLHSRGALVEASGGDVFVQSSAPLGDPAGAWTDGTGGVAWYTVSRRRRGAGWLTVVAEPARAPTLLSTASAELGDRVSGLTVPAAVLPHLDERDRPDDPNHWEWFFTADEPPVQPGEALVTWADATDEPAIQELLDTDSPRHSSRPGDPDVLRWCMIREPDGELVACAALVEHVVGVAHLASIVTRADRRGRGLGRAVTAWITRQVLDSGAPVVTLGMYADNDVARRVYVGLGYTRVHVFASGYLPGRRGRGGDDPVHDEAG